LLLGIHIQLASRSHCPELEMTQKEAHDIAEAIARVQAHYPALEIPDKYMCWISLGGLVAVTYGTKVAAIRVRLQAEKRVAQAFQAPPGPSPQQPNAGNPAPAAASTFDPIANWEPFGAEAPTPANPINFPINGSRAA
jgi:hypothetical protein